MEFLCILCSAHWEAMWACCILSPHPSPRQCVYAAFCKALLQWVMSITILSISGFLLTKSRRNGQWDGSQIRTGPLGPLAHPRNLQFMNQSQNHNALAIFCSARKYTKYFWPTQRDNAQCCLDRFLDGNPADIRTENCLIWLKSPWVEKSLKIFNWFLKSNQWILFCQFVI